MKELDFSSQIRAKFYPIEECDDCALAAERFGGKKRSELKDSDFLDAERRSFPVMSCKDVSDAVSAWGRYKGSMSFESFKSKLTAKAKKLGCTSSLPEKWKDESEAKDWEKTDTKELKRDSKKEKEEHEKDAVKDDQKKIKNLKNGKPSEKKSVEKHDLKKDEEMDEEDEEKIEESDAELTKEQKTLPPKLQEMILKKKKEKKD
jgi:hypothetical protein